jgi:hypothetical protein
VSQETSRFENNEFRITTAALGMFHTIEPRTAAASAEVLALRDALALTAPAGALKPLLVCGALVVEPSQFAASLAFLGLVSCEAHVAHLNRPA